MPKNLLTILPELDELGLRWALWFSILHAEGKGETKEYLSFEGEQQYKALVRDIAGMRRYVAFCDREKFTKYMSRRWRWGDATPELLKPLFKALDREDPC